MNAKVKKYLRKAGKIVLWIIGSVIGLFLLLVLLLQIPYFQNLAKDEAVSYLEGKIGTKVELDRIEIGLPKKVILEGFYFESQQGDTLLAGEKLAVDISLFKLFSNEVEINSINLEGITANVKRNKDSVFNFDYIIRAFASDKPKDTTSAPMKFSIDKINLDRIKIRYDDAITRNNLAASIGHFDTRIKTFDLEKLEFEIPKITLDGLKLTLEQGMVAQVAQSTQKAAEEASKQPNLKLKLGVLALSNIDIGYDNEGSRLDTGIVLKTLNLDVNEIDLRKQLIDLKSLELKGLKGQLAFGKFEKQVQEALPAQSAAVQQAQWKFKLGNTDIDDVAFKFDNQNFAPAAKGIDYNHLDISNLTLNAKDFSYGPDAISGNIDKFTLRDKSGVDIKELRTEFFYGPKGAELKGLYLETPSTLLKDQIIVSYPSLESLQTDIGELGVNANLEGSKVGFKDVLLFVPTLADTPPFKGNPNGTLNISSRMEGKVKDLYIANLEVSGIGSTSITASGRIKGLPDVKTAYMDLNVKAFRSTSKDINSYIPPGTIPANIQLPANLLAKAKFKGTLENFSTNINLVSSFGNANVKATFDQRRKNYERYDADADIQNFDIGKLIKNDSLGKVTLKAKVKGTGLNPQTANALVDGKLAKAEFNGYTYRDLAINGKINKGAFDIKAAMDDPNLDFQLVASGGFKDKYPNGKIRLNVDIADLNKLNLHAGPLKLRGNVDADIADADPYNLNGTISLHHFMFANAEEEFALDSISIVALTKPDTTSITLQSSVARAKITGKYNVAEVGTAVSNTFTKYYNSNPSAQKKTTSPQQFDIELVIDNDPVLYKLIPAIERLEPITMKGAYNSVNDSIVLNGSIPRVVYGNYTISGAKIDIKNEEDALAYNVVIDQVQGEQFVLPHTSLTGNIKDNTILYTLRIEDAKEKEQYLVTGQLRANEGNTELQLNPDGLKLNYEPWDVAVDNLLRFGKDGIYANNFEISNEGGAIKLQSQSEAPNSPLNVELRDFKIETLTNMIQKDDQKFKGTINGTAEVRDLTQSPVFVADLDITDFAVAKDTVGNIKVLVNNEVANTYAAKVEITGQDNQVNLDGNYNTTGQNFDLDLNIEKLNIASIQALSFGQVKDCEGYLSGRFDITGTASDPNISGNLKFNDVVLRVTQLNSKFKGMNDNITVNESGIRFDNFDIEDEKNNQLTINGTIATTDYRDFAFNLTVDAENFRAVNSKAKDNDFYYGKLFIDTHLNVKGTMNAPVIDGDLKVNEDTEFTVVLPQQDPSIADREGIVEFIDQDNMEMQQRLKIEETVNATQFKGMDVSVNIQIVKEAELNLVIDKGNGDFLQLKGEADLTGGIDQSGKTTLAGRYEFDEGAYQMTFNLIKRKFDIQKGSYILWTGEPTEADVNITAVYKADIPPIDLVENQITDPARRNMYKQKIPIHTLLKINGELLKPELSFDIIVPEGNYNVAPFVLADTNTKLAQIREQPSELNKQVFAILLLNRFIGENPFASEAGGTSGEALARQSVSKLLSQQLNNLAGDLINGVELNFDLEATEDYTTGQQENRTDLNVGISKRLLNDRLKVTVGSSFGLEGPQQANEETTNIAGDVAVDYQLTKDGRYMVRAYRKNEYQIALQGQVVETGVAFIITMDYNKFSELFHRTEEEKEAARQERERRKREREEKKRRKTEAEQKGDKKDDLPPNSTNEEDENK
ncbi:translocation/assembly module TamB domain-containing protein [Flavobacterium sp. MFBS3-15]|uniref:translocation/assembly module TamB domain-containing protein n=1 Tax=Flavobacterium sp. MFBS3-15 TaxID=2989816 RepID=UPI0022355594|nr:translocation/assembly module TamB domain-containing protein [Flavobacterium sp. MFBS3-15]MCW4470156.1 translocation/assembly module TamB domain-containing protein [Flavobacterium sp. MFBS3-15]